MIVKFLSSDGEYAGTPIDVPVDSSLNQLELLVNDLLKNEDKVPYAFYINDIEFQGTTFRESLTLISETNNLSFEDVLAITFQPLSLFRVRPVSRCAETMSGHSDAVLHVSYSPDGHRLASGGGDMAVRFWNVTTSMPMHTCEGHKAHVLCTAWSPDGRSFVSADKSGEIRQWDPQTGLPRGAAMRGHRKWVTSLSFEPLHADPRCVRLASASKDNSVIVWNVLTGRAETTLHGHMDSVEGVRWGGCGLIYTCSRDRTIKVWAIDGSGRSQHKLVRTLSGHAHRVNALALNCDYALRTGCYSLGSAAFSSFSSSPSLERSDEELERMRAAALERYQAVVGARTAEVVLEAGEGEGEGAEEVGAPSSSSSSLSLLGGERLVSCSDDFTLFMWRPQAGKAPLARLTGHQQLVNHLAFSPDGRYLASASFDKKVRLWCGRTGKFLATLNGHVGAVYQVAWSPDSAYLVSASKDSTVKLWSMKSTKKAAATLPGHEDEVYTLDWSPGTGQVASGSKDRTIKIWAH